MDDRRFDQIALAVAAGSTRRIVLSRLGSGALAALLAALGLGTSSGVVDAKSCRNKCNEKKKKKKRRQCRKKCQNKPECRNNADCPTGEVCEDGICIPDVDQCTTAADCDDCEECDSGICVGTCAADEVCIDDSCCPDAQACGTEVDPVCCTAEQTCVGTTCQDVCADPCGTGCCEADETCIDSAAGATCCLTANVCSGLAEDDCCPPDRCITGEGFCCPEDFIACGLACCGLDTPVCVSPGTCAGLAGQCPGGACTGGPGSQGTCNAATCNCNGDPGVCIACTRENGPCTVDDECCGTSTCCDLGGSFACKAVCI